MNNLLERETTNTVNNPTLSPEYFVLKSQVCRSKAEEWAGKNLEEYNFWENMSNFWLRKYQRSLLEAGSNLTQASFH